MDSREVIDLLERSLRGEITLVDLETLWPEQPMDARMAEIRRDLSFALEHLPRDLRRWPQMPEFEDVQLHIKHLRRTVDLP